MHDISNTIGFVGFGETPGETGDFTTSSSRKAFYKDIINRANSISIINVFKHYGLRLDENNRKIICPFISHQGGRENTPSFWVYPQTNTFWCFGCKIGVGCCDFVAEMDNITKTKAAFKILDLFNSDSSEESVINRQNFSEKLEIMMDFSNTVREARRLYLDEKSQKYIEYVCSVYDALNAKHKDLSNEALRSIVDQLKLEILSKI